MTTVRHRSSSPGMDGLRPARAKTASGEPTATQLRQAATGMALAPDDQAIDRLLRYQAMILRWNRIYNLTALRDPAAVFEQHLLDSLSIVAPLRERLAATPGVIVDVGSGAGLPGIPLAILWPERVVHVVEPVGKKAAFLTQCRIDLALPNLRVHECRAQALARADLEGPVALLVCRAFASLRGFVDATAHLVATDTILAAMKGARWQQECDAYQPDQSLDPVIREVIAIDVPGMAATRALVILRMADDQSVPAA
ncbi:MAG: 16S rRNA (guanine(527)-N(7))-methyltransferase RsmG [Burkholderiaceae bacterium]